MARVAVNEERCKACGYCIDVCAKENLYIDQGRQNSSGYNVATFNPNKNCNGCALCAETCPDVALEVYR